MLALLLPCGNPSVNLISATLGWKSRNIYYVITITSGTMLGISVLPMVKNYKILDLAKLRQIKRT